MSLIEQLNVERKARLQRMNARAFPEVPDGIKKKLPGFATRQTAPEEITVQEIPVTTEADLIERLQAENAELKAKMEARTASFQQSALVPPPPDEPPLTTWPAVALIRATVAKFYGIKRRDMESEQRHQKICKPRQIAMHLCCRLTTRSLPFIGRQFGGKDHTTVMHARNRIALLRSRDEAFDAELMALEQRITLLADEAKDAA